MKELKIRKANREILRRFKGICAICGEDDINCLEVHHIGDKHFSVSSMINNVSTKELKEELKECICVCANCHKKIHSDEIIINSQ